MDAELELQRLRCGAQLESRNRASTLHKANARFAEDLKLATREVLLCAPSLSAQSVQRMIPLLQRVQH